MMGFYVGSNSKEKTLTYYTTLSPHTSCRHICKSYTQSQHESHWIIFSIMLLMDVNIFFVSHFECPVLSIRVLYCVYTKGFRILKDGSLYSLVFSKSLVYAIKKEMARGVQKTRQCGTILLQVCRTRKRLRMGGADGLRKKARLSIMLSHLTDEK